MIPSYGWDPLHAVSSQLINTTKNTAQEMATASSFQHWGFNSFRVKSIEETSWVIIRVTESWNSLPIILKGKTTKIHNSLLHQKQKQGKKSQCISFNSFWLIIFTILSHYRTISHYRKYKNWPIGKCNWAGAEWAFCSLLKTHYSIQYMTHNK